VASHKVVIHRLNTGKKKGPKKFLTRFPTNHAWESLSRSEQLFSLCRIAWQRFSSGERHQQRIAARSPFCGRSEGSKIVVVEGNMTMINSLTELSDEQLTAQVIALADGERRATVALIASLAEFDARRLYLAAGVPHSLRTARRGCTSRSTRPTAASKRRVPPDGFRCS
jgi:hypothetical protein